MPSIPHLLTAAALATGLITSPNLLAQAAGFSAQKVITTAADRAYDVFAADLDGDGDPDVLSASGLDGKIAWYENLGGGNFGPQQVISTTANGARSVDATDLDGDGDVDVVSASSTDDKIAWYENLGSGNFGPEQIISTAANCARSVFTADLDQDGDTDVLSASVCDDKIAWYENLGGSFGPQQTISTAAAGASDVHAADLDGDGDLDVLSVSLSDDKVAWYENLGAGSFGPQQLISNGPFSLLFSVQAPDLDGDGDADVMTVSRDDSMIVWFSNLGGGAFGPMQVVSLEVTGPTSASPADLDGDGDLDVVAINTIAFDQLVWLENLGAGVFGSPQEIEVGNSPNIIGGSSVITEDVDGDGDLDVLTASVQDDKIAWYTNRINESIWSSVGFGVSGSTGVPALDGLGLLDSGTPVSLTMINAKAGASAFLIVGFSALNAPFMGGVLVPSPDTILGPLPVNGSGVLSLAGTWPAGTPTGTTVIAQFWVQDTSAVAGLSATNALEAITP